MTDAVRITDVDKSYGRVSAARSLSLAVAPGEVVTVVGPSGCGKSTLLRLVAGLERPDSGRIEIAGRVVSGEGHWQHPEHRRVGLVFQDHALFPHLDVADNVGFGLEALSRAARRDRVAEVLGIVHLGHLAGRYPHELSGGEQQRVALARALAPRPAVVLLDEPFSSLDESLRARVRAETMQVLRATGTTAILVTHDQTEALSVADRVLVMREGTIEQSGPPPEVFERPRTRFVASFMGDADFLPTRVTDGVATCELGVLDRSCDRPDGPADAVLRPHEVSLVPDPDGEATVVAVEYHGAFVLHTVALPSGRRLRSWQPHSVRHPLGTRVHPGLVDDVAPVLLDAVEPQEAVSGRQARAAAGGPPPSSR